MNLILNAIISFFIFKLSANFRFLFILKLSASFGFLFQMIRLLIVINIISVFNFPYKRHKNGKSEKETDCINGGIGDLCRVSGFGKCG